VEGISTGDFIGTIKKDLPVWSQWVEEGETEDIGGKHFRPEEGQWHEMTAEPTGPLRV
jgi:hypothetical protein